MADREQKTMILGDDPAASPPPAIASPTPVTMIDPAAIAPPSPTPATMMDAASAVRGAPAGGTMHMDSSALPRSAAGDADGFVGRELGGYRITRKIAEGGMGVVYEGRHDKIGRTGAIKVLKADLCRSEAVVDRFHQEARAVNSIRHENIVDIYDFGRDSDGRAFFVMEYLEGETLADRIRRGAMPWSEGLPVLEQTLHALEAAHALNFVHRDLKPDNIWLKRVDGHVQVKLLDFGIAKLLGHDGPEDNLTRTGAAIGTPHYMSPEQINGARDLNQRTDIYALGVIIFEMFSGRAPFSGDSMQAVMAGHLFKEPPRLQGLAPALGVPAGIAEIVARMLVKDAASRYQSVGEVLADLQDIDSGAPPTHAGIVEPVQSRPTTVAAPPGAAASIPSRSRAPIAVGVLVAAGMAAGIAILKMRPAPPPPAAVAPAPAPAPAAPVALDYAALRVAAQTTLRESLRVVEPAVRVQGSDDLGKIKDQPSVPALTDLTERDPDAEVRGHSAAALGALGASSTARVLTRLEDGAPPALKVWYASALARLGDKGAVRRLLAYARSTDLAVAFPAGLMLADATAPGDKKVTAALQAMTSREAELAQQDPFAGVTLAAKLTALRDARARDYLYGLLGHAREDVRLAAAEGLARLGNDEGKTVLGQVAANPGSPNRLVAAVTQIAVGEYGGLDVMTHMLNDKDPRNRRLAASGVGQIGDRRSLPALVALAGDPDWTVRLEVARAIVAIVGLDPALLAQAAVDWTKSALDAQDLAVRRAAASVLADIPAADAIPLLALAIKDKEPSVRREASKSAGKMKSAPAAVKVADALATESDLGVKEQQVRALGEIGAVGNPAAHDALVRVSEQPGRIGVLAAGSLIAVGDAAANARLMTAIASQQTELRLAAVEAAAIANDSIVVPTLKIGLGDHVFNIRFMSALGLALYDAERADAVPVLNTALASKDFDVVGRAMAALRRFGEAFTRPERRPNDLLNSADPTQRLAVIPAVRVMPGSEAVPLLRRLIADADPDVRRAGVDAIETLKDKEQAVRLYKPMIEDGDPLIRCRAAGQLARLVPPIPLPPGHAEAAPATDPARARAEEALSSAKLAANEVTTEIDGMERMLAELSTTMAATPAPGDVPTDHVKQLAASVAEGRTRAEAALARAEAAARAAADAAGASPPPQTASMVGEATASAQRAREALAVADKKATDAVRKASDFIADWTGDAQLDIDTANAKIDTGDFAEARRLLDKATRELRKSGSKSSGLDFAYAQLFDKMAIDAESPADQQKLLQKAADAYRRVVKGGGGRFARVANERLSKIPDEISALGTP